MKFSSSNGAINEGSNRIASGYVVVEVVDSAANRGSDAYSASRPPALH